MLKQMGKKTFTILHSNHLVYLYQIYIHANLVIILQLLFEVCWMQETANGIHFKSKDVFIKVVAWTGIQTHDPTHAGC